MTAVSSLADDLPKPLLRIDPSSGRVIACNTAAEETLGLSRRQILKASMETLFPSASDMTALVERVAEGALSIVVRDVNIGASPTELTLFPSGDDVGLLVVTSKTFTPRALQGRSVRSLGQMIGHEIKNPLAGMKGAAQLLRDEVTTSDAQSLVDVITSEIDRVKRLAERLETFGDANTEKFGRCNVHTLLRNARKLMQHASPSVVFTEDYDPSLPHVQGDSDQLMQAVLNLIKNASEAVGPDGGDVVLKTRSRWGAKRGGRGLPVEIQVIDSGVGIPSDMQARVFEPFVTTKPSGQGLGLAMVARTVEAHGGLVEVSSKPGSTRFSILLPALSSQGVT